MRRVVIDTNVFVSALLSPRGVPAQVLEAWRERRFLLLTTAEAIAEIQEVLNQPRIRRKYVVTDEDIAELIDLLRTDALVVSGDAEVKGAVPADPQDEVFLACALEGEADVIVSGDRHLLELGSFREIPIMTPRQFLDWLGSAGT